MLKKLQDRVRKLKNDIYIIALAIKDPRVPLLARILTVITIAYMLSPIDLIPDFIPVLGLLDDIIILPALIIIIIKLIPSPVIEEYRKKVTSGALIGSKSKWIAMILIICVWIGTAAILFRLLYPLFSLS